MRIVFLGPPGCGKGTQAALLRDRLGFTVVGTGDIFRAAIKEDGPLGKKVKPFIENGCLVSDDLVNEIVADYFRRDTRPTKFIMDGYPRTLAQAISFEAVMRQNLLDLTDAILFGLPDDEVVRRLGGRRLTENRPDDDEVTVRKRLAVYHAAADDLIGHYRRNGLLREIDATGDVEAVYRRVVGLFQK